MKKLFGIGLLLASCTSEPPVNFNVGNNIVCGNIEALSIKLNECLSESCHYQVPVDAGFSSQDMNADDGIVGADIGFENDDFGPNPEDMSVDQTENIVNLGPECNPNLEEVLDKCHDIFKMINDCNKGILNRDSGLDFDISDSGLDMTVDNNLNN